MLLNTSKVVLLMRIVNESIRKPLIPSTGDASKMPTRFGNSCRN